MLEIISEVAVCNLKTREAGLMDGNTLIECSIHNFRWAKIFETSENIKLLAVLHVWYLGIIGGRLVV